MGNKFYRVETHFGPEEQGPLAPRELTPDEYSFKPMTPDEATIWAKAYVERMFGKGSTEPVAQYMEGQDGAFSESNWDAGLKPEFEYDPDKDKQQVLERFLQQKNELDQMSQEEQAEEENVIQEIEDTLVPHDDPALERQIELIRAKQKLSAQRAKFIRARVYK